MNLECNSLTSCSYSAFELIADQSIYFAAKNIMDQDARNGPGIPLAVALISKIGSISLYYGKKLHDQFIHPVPSMSYSGIKGIFGAYIADYLHRYSSIGSRAGMAVTITAANILNIAEYFLFDSEHQSTTSSFFCDYSWKNENETIYSNATNIAYNTFSSAAFDLLADIPNIALRFGTISFMFGEISKRKFSRIFAISSLTLVLHALVLRFGNQDSAFIRNAKILNSRTQIPVITGMLLKPCIKSMRDGCPNWKVVAMYSYGVFLFYLHFATNALAIPIPNELSFSDYLNRWRVIFRTLAFEGACTDWKSQNITSS